MGGHAQKRLDLWQLHLHVRLFKIICPVDSEHGSDILAQFSESEHTVPKFVMQTLLIVENKKHVLIMISF
jgi:hypothetical protein